jgi:formylglycine-generating enzyme required for sulfatase activity
MTNRVETDEVDAALEKMIWVPSTDFTMGSDRHYPEEAPAHRVHVDGFWMDATAVTNRDFERFVEATGYVTLAERPPDAKEYPGAKAELLSPGSIVFKKPIFAVDLRNHYAWWAWVKGASWRKPEGKGSSTKLRMDHPVVHVAYEDAVAYATWAGKALPTEAEWECAARGGLDGAEFAWGDELTPEGKYLANFWQGDFPLVNEMRDGFARTAPVRTYPANGYGLFEMTGNVWEWTTDWYTSERSASCCPALNPRGGTREASVDPRDSASIPRKVMKGGSFLCAANYCRRYRPAARMAQPIDTATCHLGFRCIVRTSAR